MPAKIERRRVQKPATVTARVDLPTDPTKRSLFGGRISPKKLMQFTNQLSTLQSAGVTIVRSLRICERQLKPGPLKTVIANLGDDVEGGASFSEALGKHPGVFDRLYVNMIRAGEKGGILDEILARLAEFSEKSERIKARIKEALTYPVVVLLFALAVIVFVMLVIVPQFEKIFQQFGKELPAVTQLLIDISRSLTTHWWAYLGVPFLLFGLYKVGLRNPKFRYAVDKLKLRSPIAGPLIEKTIIARFSRTLGTLLSSGVPILEALEIIESSIENRVMSKAMGDIRASVREGETMATPLEDAGVFDDLVVNLIDVGETTGSLDKMLLKIADTYEEEVDVQVGTLFKMMEPILLLALAVIVGFIVVALFLPILKVMDSFAQQ